jgi:ubiquinone biosynthesis protein
MRSGQLVIASLAAFGVFAASLLRHRDVPHAVGISLTTLCTRLGATFIKIGQIVSTRSDLLPGGVIDELKTLQDRVPPFLFEAVRATVEAELDRPLEVVFSEFAREPVAAASVAQVHRARLRDSGREVAVKVRRPDIGDKVALDRSILLFLARAGERLVPSLRLVSLEAAMRQFCDAVADQIDLSLEAAHNRRFRANFADDPEILFPTLEDTLCTRAVLTMEFVEGVREEQISESGIDPQRVVEAGMRAVARMIYVHGFVHADLHPGNLRFLPPGHIVFLDLGLVGELGQSDRVTSARLVYAFATGDGATVARLFYDHAAYKATPDYAAFEADVAIFIERVSSRGLADLQVTLEIGRLFDILRRHKVQAASHMTMANLAMATAEGLGKRLAPELSLTEAALPYLAEALGLPSQGAAVAE